MFFFCISFYFTLSCVIFSWKPLVVKRACMYKNVTIFFRICVFKWNLSNSFPFFLVFMINSLGIYSYDILQLMLFYGIHNFFYSYYNYCILWYVQLWYLQHGVYNYDIEFCYLQVCFNIVFKISSKFLIHSSHLHFSP